MRPHIPVLMSFEALARRCVVDDHNYGNFMDLLIIRSAEEVIYKKTLSCQFPKRQSDRSTLRATDCHL